MRARPFVTLSMTAATTTAAFPDLLHGLVVGTFSKSFR